MSFFRNMLNSIVVNGRALRDSAFRRTSTRTRTVEAMLGTLLSVRGEASGVTIAREILDHYKTLSPEERGAFFKRLATEYGPNIAHLDKAWAAYEKARSPESFRNLLRAVEPPRQELFRRINRASGGTAALVAMRWDLIKMSQNDPSIIGVDDDLAHLLGSWFNPGFLILQRVSWSSPADILERIIRHEAVHTIQGWEDLQRRVQPSDRRCYAFFHPSLVDEPLIFVEVALTAGIPGSIQEVLADKRAELQSTAATTAVFYSISNCQPGLKGISLGNFLIKQVVLELKKDLPNLKTFVTLSPAPGFGAWLKKTINEPPLLGFEASDIKLLGRLETGGWHQDKQFVESIRSLMMKLGSTYYLTAKSKGGAPLDPVARFHLGNGARLERLNWLGDISPKGLAEGAGLMVNYLYDLETIEANHEAYANVGQIAAAPAIHKAAREALPRAAEERIAAHA